MRIRARKVVVYAVAAALAVANGYAPRHAHAVSSAVASVMSGPQHDNTEHHAGSHHDGAGAKHLTAEVICHSESRASPDPQSPQHSCCVASCSAVALIFANADFVHPIPRADYAASPPVLLTPAALTSADPPPR